MAVVNKDNTGATEPRRKGADMPARKNTTSESTTTPTRKPKALPGKQNGGIGRGGVVTRHV